MNTRERLADDRTAHCGEGGPEGPGSADVLEAARQEAEHLARAGSNQIRRVLSGDSETFLRNAVQHGAE